MKRIMLLGATLMVLLLASCVSAPESSVDVDLSVKHEVGGISQFDRMKYMNVHTSLTDTEWNGEEKEMEYLLEDLDVYVGRDNGSMGSAMHITREDPNRPGYVSEEYMINTGRYMRESDWGELKWDKHEFDDRADMMIGGQANPFWPGHVTRPYVDGRESYEIGGAHASGYFMGLYLNEFFRDPDEPVEMGQRRPKWIEIINEPFWHVEPVFQVPAIDIFEFHNEVAAGIREVNDDVMIGGYTVAFPWFDNNDFAEWEDYMKLFIDTCGDSMDFFSLHFYDFNTIRDRSGEYAQSMYYRGGRLEATMDMMEQYSLQRLGEIKPMIISEYGIRGHEFEQEPWSPQKDWAFTKAFSMLTLQFMDRPDVILKSVPFIPLKAEWGRDPMTKDAYDWRLMRQAFEGEGESGEAWVFTDWIKFYELWSDVKGTRVSSDSSNPDVLVDTYVDGDEVYVIVSNLAFGEIKVPVTLAGIDKSMVDSVSVKHHYADKNDVPVLDEKEFSGRTSINFTIGSEGTAIFNFHLTEAYTPERTMLEEKFYSMDYLQPIEGGQAIEFDVDGVSFSGEASAVLRLGFSRDHDLSKTPVVTINGTELVLPVKYSGNDQTARDQWFGMVEIPVSGDLLQENNSVGVSFPEAGGYVTTVSLKVFSIE